MAGKIAHFPSVRDLDGFDLAAQPSLDPRQIRELAACRWVAHGEAPLYGHAVMKLSDIADM